MSLSTTACRFHSPAVTIRRSGAAASPAVARPAPGLTRPARDVARFAWGKDEKGEEGKIYIQGEFVDDPDGRIAGTGKDNEFVGGFAGGEKGLWELRDEVNSEPKTMKAEFNDPNSKSKPMIPKMDKDFNGLVGGFPGGEVGVKAYSATGEVPTRDADPTLGWGPPVFFFGLLGAGYYVLSSGVEVPEGLQATVGASSLSVPKIELPVSELVAAEEALPPEVKELFVKGAAGLVGVYALGTAAAFATKKAADVAGNAVKVGLLGATSLAVAGKILELY